MAEWQPIATAPKDGTKFLGAYRGWARQSGRWVMMVMRANRKRMRFEPYPTRGPAAHRQPTHWMPLPAPPPGLFLYDR